jgi:hypothetical protein
MGRVGFLWDSLSDNTGDQAIGLTLLRLARRAGIQRIEAVRIGERLAGRYDMLVIGGGELLCPADRSFFDAFRVPGEHVLNTMGTNGPVEASHLSSYRLVSVRSSADRDNLRGLSRQVKVAPCLSILFDGLAEDRVVPMERNSILLHLHAGAIQPNKARMLASLLRRLGPPVGLLPFIRHARDGALLSVLAAAAGLAPPLAVTGPDQAFASIRRSRAVVVSSLHAMLFAYIARVPFLVIPYAPKIGHFLAERGLEHRMLPDILRLPEKLHFLAPDSVDWQAPLAADKAAAGAIGEEILALAEDALSKPEGGRNREMVWTEPADPVSAHTEMMARIEEFGLCRAQITADVLAGRHRARRMIAAAIRAVVKRVPAIRRLKWVESTWRRWLATHSC